ncbi:branched-chain amino acid ABC transporter permease [Thermodesulfobacteriota bacterium]
MLIQSFVNGLSLGSIYALVALGYVLLWKSSEVLNFAQGDFMMLGAFLAFTAITMWGFPPWVAFLFAIVAMGFLGILLERVFMRPLLGEPIFAIAILTLGLSIMMRSLAGLIWGNFDLKFPSYLSEEPLNFLGIVISPINLMIIIITFIIIVGLAILLKFSKIGIAMRAVGLNQLASLYLGVDVTRFLSLNWIIASILGCVAGILVGPFIFLSTNLGHIGLKAFPAAILGGFTSLPGAIVGGLIIGVTENMAAGYLPSGLKDVVPWLVLFIILIIRPAGIFGIKEVKRV